MILIENWSFSLKKYNLTRFRDFQNQISSKKIQFSKFLESEIFLGEISNVKYQNSNSIILFNFKKVQKKILEIFEFPTWSYRTNFKILILQKKIAKKKIHQNFTLMWYPYKTDKIFTENMADILANIG